MQTENEQLKIVLKTIIAERQAIIDKLKKETCDKIDIDFKYQEGRYDFVQEILNLIEGGK